MFGLQYQDDARSFLQGSDLEEIASTAGNADDHVKHVQITLRSGHVFDFPVSEGSLSAVQLESKTKEEPEPPYYLNDNAVRARRDEPVTTLKLFARLRRDPKKPLLYTITEPPERPAPLAVPGIENGPVLLYATPGKDGAPPTLTNVLTEPDLPEQAKVLAPLVLAALTPPTKPRKRNWKKVHA